MKFKKNQILQFFSFISKLRLKTSILRTNVQGFKFQPYNAISSHHKIAVEIKEQFKCFLLLSCDHKWVFKMPQFECLIWKLNTKMHLICYLHLHQPVAFICKKWAASLFHRKPTWKNLDNVIISLTGRRAPALFDLALLYIIVHYSVPKTYYQKNIG